MAVVRARRSARSARVSVLGLAAAAGFALAAGGVGRAAAPERSPAPSDRAAADIEPSLRAAIEEALRAVEPESAGAAGTQAFRARNPAAGLSARFTPEAFEVRGGESGEVFRAELRLVEAGRGEALHPVSPASLAAEGARIEYRRGSLVEWYENAARGIEQGFTLEERPIGPQGEPLRVVLSPC